MTTWAGRGWKAGAQFAGALAEAQLGDVHGIALDSQHTCYLAEFDAGIRRITNVGSGKEQIGPLATAEFSLPHGIAAWETGGSVNLLVADHDHSWLDKMVLSGSGQWSTQKISLGAQPLLGPEGVTAGGAGTIYVADTYNHCIRRIQAGSSIVFAGVCGQGNFGYRDGLAATAQFHYPQGLALAPEGETLYVTDIGNHCIRSISSGQVSTIAGQCGQSGSRDGPGGQTLLKAPGGVAVDRRGVLYVSDRDNHCIKRVAFEQGSWQVSTIAGGCNEPTDLSDGLGTAARFNSPCGIAIDRDQSTGKDVIYVADTGNHAIRRLTY